MGEEGAGIVIVGGGICGLAMALAFHRKGVRSLVLERSETLRSCGSGIAIQANGWRALDHLGVGSKLRLASPIALQELVDIDLDSGKQRKAHTSMMGEARCVRRSDLINVLAEELPHGTIRFESEVLSVKLDPVTSFPVLQLSNGSTIRTKVLIGCDGANSAVANFLELKPTKVNSLSSVRGFTNYPNGHSLPPQLVRLSGGSVFCGKVPVDDKQVFWFVVQKSYPKDSKIANDPELIKQFALDGLKDFPEESMETHVKDSDLTSVCLTHLRYRAPWGVLLGVFRRGTVTVAGDAMHVMSPFLGQGGVAGIEDAVVLARCLSPKMSEGRKGKDLIRGIEEAIDQYIKERRMRLVWLSTQAFLAASMLEASSMFVRVIIIFMLLALFRNPVYHARYDCGRL